MKTIATIVLAAALATALVGLIRLHEASNYAAYCRALAEAHGVATQEWVLRECGGGPKARP